MKIKITIFLIVCIQYHALAQPKIVLKFDDIGVTNHVCKASPVMDYLLQREIKASYGVIAKKIDNTALATLSKYIQAENSKGEKMVEFWHHGFDHSNNNPPNNKKEFSGTSYEFQKKHFNDADQMVLRELGVQMITFGAPFNVADSTTLKVISENSNYKLIFFSGLTISTYPEITGLNNRVNLEKGVGNPNYEYFVSQYEKNVGFQKSFMVLQGHPNNWTEQQFNEFIKVIDFLVQKRCEFILPLQLLKHHNN